MPRPTVDFTLVRFVTKIQGGSHSTALHRCILRVFLLALGTNGGGPIAPGLVAQDDLDAVRAAAEQGDAEAQLELGLMYETGAGVIGDYTETAGTGGLTI